MSERGHSPLGMSVLERRYCCPGSLRLEAGKTDTPSSYARRGTMLHAAAAECLITGTTAAEFLPDDPEGADIVQTYMDIVSAAHARLGGGLSLEQPFQLEALHQLFWGTCDAVVLAPPRAWIADLKTGAGHAVPIRRPDGRVNFQLGGYALGAIQSLPVGLQNEITEVELCVIQPRLGEPQTTVMTLAEMQDLAADLVETAEAATQPDAPLVPGEHCTFCRGAAECPALRAKALEAATIEFDIVDPHAPAAILPDPERLTLKELGHVLTVAEIVDTWVHAVRVHAKVLADKGQEIPGWKLANKIGRRGWVDDNDALRALAHVGLPVDDCYVVKTVSPAQAEKLLKRDKIPKPKEWPELILMSDPGTALVPAADKRPAAAPRFVEFEQLTQEP